MARGCGWQNGIVVWRVVSGKDLDSNGKENRFRSYGIVHRPEDFGWGGAGAGGMVTRRTTREVALSAEEGKINGRHSV